MLRIDFTIFHDIHALIGEVTLVVFTAVGAYRFLKREIWPRGRVAHCRRARRAR